MGGAGRVPAGHGGIRRATFRDRTSPARARYSLSRRSRAREFGPLVFCDDSLDLDQQPGLGVVEGRGVAEQHRDLVAGELVEDQHLVGVGPGQAVG